MRVVSSTTRAISSSESMSSAGRTPWLERNSITASIPGGRPQPRDVALRARLDVLDVEADVDGPDAVGEIADRDHVDPGLGDRYDGRLVDAARGLGDGPAVNQLDAAPHLFEVHVVEHDDFDTAIERLPHLLEAFALDLDLEGVLGLGAQDLHRLPDAA